MPETGHASHGDSGTPLGWWSISGENLLAMLRRCAADENPDLVYAEEYANSDHEHIPPKGTTVTDTDREKRYVEKVRSVASDNGWQEWAPPPSSGRLRRLWLRWKWRKNWPGQDHEAPRA